MSQRATLCPNCGAPIHFQWSSSVPDHLHAQCQSILIPRTDVNQQRVGVVSDLPPDSSPIQLGTSGVYEKNAFTVAGRIIYDYAEGSWNEWHIVMNDGRSAWLSDAQSQYAVICRSRFKGYRRALPDVHLDERCHLEQTMDSR